jgi:hypothetical protein
MLANQGAPVSNLGYYDVPICNEFSNVNKRDKAIKTNEYALNRTINNTINDNKAQYTVYQDPTIPSPSLDLECDRSFAGYYYKDPLSLAYADSTPLIKKKEYSTEYNYINSDQNPPFGIEKFHGGGGGGGGRGGGGGHGGGHGGGYGGGHGGGYGGGGYARGGAGYVRGGGGYGGGHGFPRSYLPANNYASNFPYRTGYLNTAIMPNVYTGYWGGDGGAYYNDSSYYTTIPEIGNPYIQAPYVEVNNIPVQQIPVQQPPLVKEEYQIQDVNSEYSGSDNEEETPPKNKIIKKMKKEKKIKMTKNDNTLLYFIIVILLVIIAMFVLRNYKYI